MEIKIVGSGPYDGQEIIRTVRDAYAGVIHVFEAVTETNEDGNEFASERRTEYCGWTGWLSSRDSGFGSDVYWRIPPAEMRKVRDEYPDGCKDDRITWNYPDRDGADGRTSNPH